MERLTPRVRIVWLLLAIVRAAILGGIIVGAAIAITRTELPNPAPGRLIPAAVALAVSVAVLRVFVAWRRYGVWRFALRDDDLYIKRGVFTRVRTVVPYVRVQHVDSRRSPLERTVGLSTVVVYTAGSRSSDVAIPGLTPTRAEDLQESLRRLAIESAGEDAV
ncbi:PH domain-containing protein [Natrinema sp. 74]|uniref:PH domain-containing protein n=1 Tax=Natrinema sp. 74 TaxID=3384159 RepID=UPI0038D3668B